MAVYTSYFANWRKFPEDVTRFSVARELKWEMDIEELKVLSPSKALLLSYKVGDVDEEEFTAEYLKELANADPKEMSEAFKRIQDCTTDVVLLCYERKGEFCHRHVLANYLNMF